MHSSDDYFHDYSFNDAALAEIDAIESASLAKAGPSKPTQPLQSTSRNKPPAPPPPPLEADDSFDNFDDMQIDADELDRLDNFVNDVYAGTVNPIAKPADRMDSLKQMTLHGTVATQSASKPRSQQAGASTPTPKPAREMFVKDKIWGQGENECAASGEARAQISTAAPPPMKLEADLLSARHFVYPVDPRFAKRDYQFNIVRHALFENTLVTLPTGMGKTFIAGAVMLNYYRWFPQGKCIFLAPTKPLVAQQVHACLASSGISAEDAVQMTGEVGGNVREQFWQEKRVFFMTPQTVDNDLKTGRCDPRDIILVVVDEAHRCGSGYAYAGIIRRLMKTNPHFRVLALSATPSNDKDKIQRVIDAFRISHVEIRNYDSLDLRQYVHEKKVECHVIPPNEALLEMQDALADVLGGYMNKFRRQGGFTPRENALNLHPYRCNMLAQEARGRGDWGASKAFSKMSQMARGMLYLMTGSFEAAYLHLNGVMNGATEGEGSPSKKGKKPQPLVELKPVLEVFSKWRNQGFPDHPKIEKLKDLLVAYFGSQMPEEDDDLEPVQSRVMVFSSYRSVVGEITAALNQHQPLIKAAQFIGQGTDRGGKKGLSQKAQVDLIDKFQQGEYNVLVSTSIGEEGLDIGEIDVIVAYDSDASVTRMLQRFGRTGRKRAGTVHVLFAQDREEGNLKKAQNNHDLIVDRLTKGLDIHLFGDVPRLLPVLPGGRKLECKEIQIVPQKYIPPIVATARKGSTKRKRNDDIGRNIPEGADVGFQSVGTMVKNQGKKKKQKQKDFEEAGEDDEDDEAIESGSITAPLRRAQSEKTTTSKKGKQPALHKSATMNATKRAKSKAKAEPPERSSNFSDWGQDDDDDMVIEAGTIATPPITQKARPRPRPIATGGKKKKPSPSPSPSPPPRQPSVIDLSDEEDEDLDHLDESPPQPKRRKTSSAPQDLLSSPLPKTVPKPIPKVAAPKQMDYSVIDLTDSEPELVEPRPFSSKVTQKTYSPSPIPQVLKSPAIKDNDLSWIANGDSDDEPVFAIIDSPIQFPKKGKERIRVDESFEISEPTRPIAYATPQSPTKKPSRIKKRSPSPQSHVSDSEKEEELPLPHAKPDSGPLFLPSTQEEAMCMSPSRNAMPPPLLPSRYKQPESPALTQPIRRLGGNRRLLKKPFASPLKDDEENMLPPPLPRLNRRLASTPPKRKATSPNHNAKAKAQPKEKRAKPSLLDRRSAFLFEAEAEHSGSEVSAGDSASEDEEENDEDRAFLKDSPLTQRSADTSYDQSFVYRQSLLTQDPSTSRAPLFATGPTRNKPFGRIEPRGAMNQRWGGGLHSSSPPPAEDYEMDSFVVNDDEEIEYEDDSRTYF